MSCPFFRASVHITAVTTRSEIAQKYFDQGLAFLYSFDQDAALTSFEAAAVCDPDCAMAYWGIAMSEGAKVDDPEAAAPRTMEAYKASREALKLAGDSSPVEQSLIKAIAQRFDILQETDPAAREQSYASAMRRAWQAFPDDPDVGALTAKAISAARSLDVCAAPGQALPPSPEVVRSLETVLARHPDHPFALHLLIHALEGTDQFEQAKPAADRLRDYAPGLSHLTHMPSHIDIRRGDWDAAMAASQRAIASEKDFEKLAGNPGFYRVMVLHNYHMLIYIAAMQGRSELATQAAKEVLTQIPTEYRERDVERVDFYYAAPLSTSHPFRTLERDVGRTCARLTICRSRRPCGSWERRWPTSPYGESGEAKFQQATLVSTVMSFFSVPLRSRKINGRVLFKVAAASLGGQGLYGEGKVDEAIAQLREAA